MYVEDTTPNVSVREIHLPSVAFQLLVRAVSENIQWAASQNQSPLPAHLSGKRVLTFFGVRYVEEQPEGVMPSRRPGD